MGHGRVIVVNSWLAADFFGGRQIQLHYSVIQLAHFNQPDYDSLAGGHDGFSHFKRAHFTATA